jgi:hypothetical protein
MNNKPKLILGEDYSPIFRKVFQQHRYNLFFDEFMRMHPECPHCHSTEITDHGKVERNIYLSSSEHVILWIHRVRCHNPRCGKTARILPPDVIKFKRYALDFIKQVIELTDSFTAPAIEKLTHVSRSLVSYWYKQFTTWHEVGLHALGLRLDEPNIEAFQNQYKEQFGYDFLQVIPL